jgi:hypothetical protein
MSPWSSACFCELLPDNSRHIHVPRADDPRDRPQRQDPQTRPKTRVELLPDNSRHSHVPRADDQGDSSTKFRRHVAVDQSV